MPGPFTKYIGAFMSNMLGTTRPSCVSEKKKVHARPINHWAGKFRHGTFTIHPIAQWVGVAWPISRLPSYL